jgi:hypothetical protein
MIPGEIILAAHGEPHESNLGLEVRKVVVSNRGDRADSGRQPLSLL